MDKRISALALAIQMGATVYDLEEAELCYAPPFGSAKDPVNFAGMVAADVLRGDMPLSHWDSVDGGFLLDVREPVELAVEQVPARSTSRWASCARASTSSRATARSTSSAAPASALRRKRRLRRDAVARAASQGVLTRRLEGCSPDESQRRGRRRRRRARPSRPCSAKGPAGTPPRRAAAGGHPGRARLPRPGRRRGCLSLVRAYQVPGTVGAIAPVQGDDGWLLAAGRGFVHLSRTARCARSPRSPRPGRG